VSAADGNSVPLPLHYALPSAAPSDTERERESLLETLLNAACAQPKAADDSFSRDSSSHAPLPLAVNVKYKDKQKCL
jgi:hypothetical protein